MFCVKCGAELEDDARFCVQCGEPVHGASPNQETAAGWVAYQTEVMEPLQSANAPVQNVAAPTPAQAVNGAARPAQPKMAPAAIAAVVAAALAVVVVAVVVVMLVSPADSGEAPSKGSAAASSQAASGAAASGAAASGAAASGIAASGAAASGATPGASQGSSSSSSSAATVIGQQPTASSSAAASSGDYILADSATRYYSRSEFQSMDLHDLYLARNEIYARHGRGFKNADLQSYFNSKSWYTQRYTPEQFESMPSPLNDCERANAELMLDVEHSRNSPYV